MQMPDWLLPRPPFDLPDEKRKAFDDLWRSSQPGETIAYHLPYPRWQFLSYLCETREVILHGSQHPGIAVVEPRQANDLRAFSNQAAIYATTDGIWVIYFAILDRASFAGMSLFNSCLRVRISADDFSEPLYFFSISQFAKEKQAWREGTVYILPRQSFIKEPAQHLQGVEVDFPHWIGQEAVQPLAKLMVSPQDFPFLAQMHGHNDEILNRLAVANPEGYPWKEAWES